MSRTAVIACAPLMLLACGVTEVPRPADPPAAPGASGGPPAPPPPPSGAGGAPGTSVPPPAMGGRGGASPPTTGVPGAGGAPNPPVPTPPPGSGQTVSINGTAVPKDKVLVFLHIGHSNMAGRTTTPQSLRPLSFETHPQLWSYAKGGVWKPAKEPLSADSMTGSCGGVGCSGLPFGAGPGMSILRTALAAAPDAHVVSIGRGQSGTTGGFCRSFRKGGLLYDAVMGPAMELKGKVTFAAIFTMLGLSEVNDRQNLARFGECMAGVASEMRADLGEPELPFVAGDWEEADGNLSRDSSAGSVIIPQLEALPDRIPRSLLIPSEGLPINPLDGHHYDLAGHKMWAERGIGLLKTKGWAPWATR